MCHKDGSRPPAPPGRAGVIADVGGLRLTASDGSEFLAYQAVPANGNGTGVVILPDMRGLHDFYRDLARRFAEAGSAALAIDYYGRTAEDDHRGAGFDGFAHVTRLVPDQVDADVRAGVDHVGVLLGVRSVFTVGFCVGGAISWRQSAVDDRVTGAIGFYGRPSECAALIPRMRAPLLVLAAGADALTPADEARRFDRELTRHGVPHTFVLYEGAPHSFFDGGLAGHAEAGADAWWRVLDFIAEGAA